MRTDGFVHVTIQKPRTIFGFPIGLCVFALFAIITICIVLKMVGMVIGFPNIWLIITFGFVSIPAACLYLWFKTRKNPHFESDMMRVKPKWFFRKNRYYRTGARPGTGAIQAPAKEER